MNVLKLDEKTFDQKMYVIKKRETTENEKMGLHLGVVFQYVDFRR
jgi:hypothetical protein